MVSTSPILVEGPDPNNDFTFNLVEMNQELASLEAGIPLSDFKLSLNQHWIDMQFRVLQKITLHKQHVLNVFNSSEIEFLRLNRYKEILPFKHNRVSLNEKPFVDQTQHKKPTLIFSCPSYQLDGPEEKLTQISIGDKRLETYYNASFIHSCIQNQPTFIACMSPVIYSLPHFWQMVWDQQISLIVMLCPVKGAHEESIEYWSKQFTHELQKIRVIACEQKTETGLISRIITLEHYQTKEMR